MPTDKHPTTQTMDKDTDKALTREQKKRQTRHAFYQAILDLCMAGQGFSSISLRQVTREVGLVPTAFYRHFKDMDELGQSLVQDELGAVMQSLRNQLKLGQRRDFDNQIAISVHAFFAVVDDRPRYWQFVASERFGGSEAVRRAIDEQIQTFASIMGEDLGLQPAFAHMTSKDRYLLAEAGLNLSFAWIVRWLEIDKSQRETMLHDCSRQMQMLLYGAYNWKSSKQTVVA